MGNPASPPTSAIDDGRAANGYEGIVLLSLISLLILAGTEILSGDAAYAVLSVGLR